MKILWLEDEPETIEVIINDIQSFCKNIIVMKCFASFSDELEEFQDIPSNKIILDIRMLFNKEIEFTCFDTQHKIDKQLDAGFEYFNCCLRDRFKHATIIFFSSKPELDAKLDAKIYEIDTDKIVSKDFTTKLIDILKDRR
jgi:CheY-like chemotaxis protein